MSEQIIFELPEQPPVGTRLQDENGTTYTHVRENVWHAIDGTIHGYNWPQLIAQHAPLTPTTQHAIGDIRSNDKKWIQSLPIRTIVREELRLSSAIRIWRKTAPNTWEPIETDGTPVVPPYSDKTLSLSSLCTIIWLPQHEKDTTMLKVGA